MAQLEVGATLTLQGQSPEIKIAFKALSNGTIKTIFTDGNSAGLSITPAPRHDLKQLLTEVMVFVPYESDSAVITITNAAGIVTFHNGATERQVQAINELPVRGGNLHTQLESYLEARYGNFTFCDCGDHAPRYSGRINKIDLLVIPNTGVTDRFIRITTHALWPRELTPEVLKLVAQLERDSAVKVLSDSNGLTLQIDVACQIFTGQNIELGVAELLSVRKQLKDTYKTRGKTP